MADWNSAEFSAQVRQVAEFVGPAVKLGKESRGKYTLEPLLFFAPGCSHAVKVTPVVDPERGTADKQAVCSLSSVPVIGAVVSLEGSEPAAAKLANYIRAVLRSSGHLAGADLAEVLNPKKAEGKG